METVSSELVPLWQDVTAEGTGSIAGIRRRASDAFACAASVNDQLLLARDSRDGRPLGCASLTIRDGIATLGGMSTVPAERNRGVQATLIGYRLQLATDLACDLAITSADPDSGSERNLARAGFVPIYDAVTLTIA